MAQRLKIDAMAERVEATEQLEQLCVIKRDQIQDYLFSPAVPSPSAEALRLIEFYDQS